MCDVEIALAAALAETGLASRESAEQIASGCDAAKLDLAGLGAGSAASGTPVPALLAQLRAHLPSTAAAELHRGATSQDIVDTATMLVARRALVPLIEDLDAAAGAAALLAEAHRDTVEPGRTLLQQAQPITFGLKAAGWMVGLDEAAARLIEVRDWELAVQLGGAAGTLAALGNQGVAVTAALARRLGLAEPTLPWQAIRLRPALLAGALGAAAGIAGKIGRDVALLAQTEVGEVSEGASGGSSTLPQKRNPVAAVAAVACSERTPGLVATVLAGMRGEHERAAGAWQAEAETLSELLRLTGSAAAAVRSLLEDLEIEPARMRSNLELGGGLLMAEALSTALAEQLGRVAAHDLVERLASRARKEGLTLRHAAGEEAAIVGALGVAGIERALDPGNYLGSNTELIERALRSRRQPRPGDR